MSEWHEDRKLDKIRRRARMRVPVRVDGSGASIALPSNGDAGVGEEVQYRWAFSMPLAKFAAEVGLSKRQVKLAFERLQEQRWIVLGSPKKGDIVVAEGDKFVSNSWLESIHCEYEGISRWTLLSVRVLTQVTRHDIIAAMLIGHLFHLTKAFKRPQVYQTAKQLADHFGVTTKQVEKAKDKLKKWNLLFVEKAKFVGPAESRYKASAMMLNLDLIEALKKTPPAE